MKTLLRACALAALVTALSGCIPGQYMGARPSRQADLVESGQVQVVPITTELVADYRPAQLSPLPPELLQYKPEGYEIGPGDTLLVTVWDHPELTSPAGTQQEAVANGRLVGADGTFYFPYAGEMVVAGKTVTEVRKELQTKLGRFLREPQVDVNVVGFGSRVTLQGALVDTAPQELTTAPLTVAQAIGRAGVSVEQADLSGLVLTRDGRNYTLDLDAMNREGNVAPEIFLKPGDKLFLPFNDRKEVYVIGEVLRPQAINFKTSDMTLTQALGRSGGLNPVSAQGSAVYVIRGAEDMAQTPATVFQLDASSPAAFTLADRFALTPGDVVFVGPAGITRWNRFISQLLPLSGIIRNVATSDLGGGGSN